jgi:hypothetical protein
MWDGIGWYRIIYIYIYIHMYIYIYIWSTSLPWAGPGPGPAWARPTEEICFIYRCTSIYVCIYSLISSYTIPHKFILSCIFVNVHDFPRNSIAFRSIWKSVPVHSVPFLEIFRSIPRNIPFHSSKIGPCHQKYIKSVPCRSLYIPDMHSRRLS